MATHSKVQTTIDFSKHTGQPSKKRKVAPEKKPIFEKPTNEEEARAALKALHLYVMEKLLASSDGSVTVCPDSLRHCYDALSEDPKNNVLVFTSWFKPTNKGAVKCMSLPEIRKALSETNYAYSNRTCVRSGVRVETYWRDVVMSG